MENSYYGLKKDQDLITGKVKRDCEEIQRKNMVSGFFSTFYSLFLIGGNKRGTKIKPEPTPAFYLGVIKGPKNLALTHCSWQLF
jgi:hypothetical protein